MPDALTIFETTVGLAPRRRAFMAAHLAQDVAIFPSLLLSRETPKRAETDALPRAMVDMLLRNPFQLIVVDEAGRPLTPDPRIDEADAAKWRDAMLAARGLRADVQGTRRGGEAGEDRA